MIESPMPKPQYGLDYKIGVIRELLKEVAKEQSTELDKDMWLWKQAERVTYISVLDILNDNLDWIPDEIKRKVEIGR